MTAPDVGPITVLVFKASIEDPERFARGEDADAFAGLAPLCDQSGERDHKGRISRAGAPMLPRALYEAANVLVGRVKRPCALGDWGRRLVETKGTKRARVAVARKPAVLLHRFVALGDRLPLGLTRLHGLRRPKRPQKGGDPVVCGAAPAHARDLEDAPPRPLLTAILRHGQPRLPSLAMTSKTTIAKVR